MVSSDLLRQYSFGALERSLHNNRRLFRKYIIMKSGKQCEKRTENIFHASQNICLFHSVTYLPNAIMYIMSKLSVQAKDPRLTLPYKEHTVYPKKYAHGFCFAVLCCGYTLTDFPISIRLTSLALWQSNDCPSASKATLMNMDKYFM